MQQPTIILFAHGSRDPAWFAPFEALATRVKARAPDAAVRLAYLEFASPNLVQAVADAANAGLTKVHVVPVFLAAGKHLREDLPQLIAQAQAAHPQLTITCASAIGEDARMLDAMANVIANA
jgi:sirohydrochlorin cobaltochelatase